MKISDLIYRLQDVKHLYGDLDVWCFSMDKYGYAVDEYEFDVKVKTKAELYIGDKSKEDKVCFIGEWE